MTALPASMPATQSPDRQIRLIVVVFAVLAGALAAAYFLFMRPTYAVLYRDLRPAEAAAVVAELKKQQIDYQVAADGTQILVPESRVSDVQLSLASAELPMKGLEGFELFNNADMGLTDFTQRIKYQRALQGELARTIMKMDGVLEARVHISIPERTLFKKDGDRAKAAVTLVTRTLETRDDERIVGVQQLVAAAIPDLEISDVVVLNGRGEVISANPSTTSAAAAASPPPSEMDALRTLAESIVRKTLADTAFTVDVQLVTIVAPEPAPTSAPADTSAAASPIAPPTDAPSVPPAPAQQGRLVSLSTPAQLAPAIQQRIKGDLRAAGVIRGSLDRVGFAIAVIAPPSPQAMTQPAPLPVVKTITQSASPAQTAVTPADAAEDWMRADILLPAICIIAFGLAVIALLLRRRSAFLSDDDRRRFADRLKLELAADMEGDLRDAR